jgi:DNA-binding transcriptional regulator GbsR (MarR family)
MNNLYNPAQKNKNALISEFVVRQDIYEEIMRDLESSKMQHPEQHYLLVGQRGMGKTTLLLRLKYGIEDSTVLGGRVLPIAFTEEQYQISELANLWEYIAEYLEDHGSIQVYNEIVKHIQDAHFEEKAYEMLDSALGKAKKNIVLLIDNIGDLFHKLDITEIRRFREILQTNSRIRVIGGSSSFLQEVLDYQQPFYEFFKIIRLDGLDKDETIKLILRLGEIYGEKEKIGKIVKDMPGRIETLRILTGGVPRTISILFGIFLDYEHENALKDLYKILDVVTPLYKHRMDDLPVQQQKIIDAVAKNWEPITVKELAIRTRVTSKTLSAQLNQLEKEQIVVKQDTATKNKTYMVRERFWNIWYLMRYGRRDDKEKIVWLVKFLESWLSDDDLKKRIESFVGKVKKTGTVDAQLQLFSKVYASLKNLPVSSKLKLKSIEDQTKEKILMSDEEWLACAQEEFDKENYVDSFRFLMESRDVFTKGKAQLIGYVIKPEAFMALTEMHGVTGNELEGRLFWGHLIILLLGRYAIPNMDGEMDHEIQLMVLMTFLKVQLVVSHHKTITPDETSMAIFLIAENIKFLISDGLYNAVYRIVDEAQMDFEGRPVFFKDVWKPLYLAVKYLHQREELEKMPAELGVPALDLEKQISGMDQMDNVEAEEVLS